MSKILIGAAAAALWFALSHVANARSIDNAGLPSRFPGRSAIAEFAFPNGVKHPGTGLDIRAPGRFIAGRDAAN